MMKLRIAFGGAGLFTGVVRFALLGLALAPSLMGQGMPPAARENIHALLQGHAQLQRELKLTEVGYEATTQSTNPVLAAVLQQHVQQMQERLESGWAVRRWDPAFAEYRAYYEEIEFKVEKTEAGVKVVARGKTPEAAKVARNHAQVINDFVNDGWTAHDALHPAALTPSKAEEAAPAARPGCGNGRCGSEGCRGGCGRGGAGKPTTNQKQEKVEK